MSSVITFSTTDDLAMKYFKPEPIKSHVPDWYKSLSLTSREPDNAKAMVDKKVFKTHLTAKACIPMRDYITSGYLIRTCADVSFTVERSGNEEYYWYYSPASSQIDNHPFHQLPLEINGLKHGYIKFINPWVIKTPPGYSCLFYQPEYFFESRFKLLPGIVDTDSHDAAINFPGYLLKEGDFVLDAGTPLMCVFPFKRDEFKAEYKIEKQSTLINSGLADIYRKFFHKKKRYE